MEFGVPFQQSAELVEQKIHQLKHPVDKFELQLVEKAYRVVTLTLQKKQRCSEIEI